MKILDLSLDTFKALIFDLDGTLLDSMPLHNKAWIRAFKEFGAHVTEEFLQETAGMSSPRIVTIVNERQKMNLNPREVSDLKRKLYLETLDQVEIAEEVFRIVKFYYKKIPLGIVTGGSHAVVDPLLLKLKINHYFQAIVCSDDTKLGKDSIAPYELMGSLIGVSPTDSLFFDDGDVGLKGAKLAGMTVVHVDIHDPKVFLKSF